MPSADPSSSELAASAPQVLLVGNPNVGKSVLFGRLTHRYVVVSNYPGTTVELTRSTMKLGGESHRLVDLPGVNNLIPQSEDERVTRDVLLNEDAERILQVADAKNLRRGLLLSVTLAEMGLPFTLVLNMMDEAAARGVRIDRPALMARLGVPVIDAVATRGKGVGRIRTVLEEGCEPSKDLRVDYGPALEAGVVEIEPLLPPSRISPRSLALMVLAGDEGIKVWLGLQVSPEVGERIQIVRRKAEEAHAQPLAYEISQARLRRGTEILDEVYRVDPAATGAFLKLSAFGESVTGRGAAHVSAFLGATLLLLSLGGFPSSLIGAVIAAGVLLAAVVLSRRGGWSGLVLLAVVAAFYALGMLVRPIAEILPGEGFLSSGWIQGLACVMVVFGVFLGRQTTHLVWGTVGAVAVLYLVYLFVGVFGAGDLVDLLEGGVFNRYIGPACISAVDAILPFEHVHEIDAEVGAIAGDYALTGGAPTGLAAVARFLHDLLVGPFGALTMALSYAIALILPVVGTFFLVFGILEDSGYLPRLAVMMNRGFKAMGLNGKAVLPMILGLGCDTMATLTTRVLETKKERVIVTLLLALGIPCSAQLGVILGITSQIGTVAILWWVGTIVFVLFTVGWLAALLLPGQRSDFILELPPLRVPRIGNILLKTLARIEWYLKEAVPLFFAGTFILFLLDWTGSLEPLKWAARPIVDGLLDLPEEVTPSFLIGFLRRDYGAAGLSDLWREGLLTPRQAVVSLVTITLFVPCIANFFIMLKERGTKTGLLMVLFILPMAFIVGGLVNLVMKLLGVLA